MPTKDHTVLIVVCMTGLAISSLTCATVLIMKGYTAELMVGIASALAGSLGTMIGQRRGAQGAVADNTNVAGDATFNLPGQPAKPQQPQQPQPPVTPA